MVNKEKMCNVLHGLKPALLMVVSQIGFAGVNVLYKLAANDGMSLRVIVAYRLLFAAAFMIPLAFIYERKKQPKFSWMIIFLAFLCGLFGATLAQTMYIESLDLTSATFAAAMANLGPAITFILAITFRLERLAIKSNAGKAKVLGTIVCIGGAMLLTFYKGTRININPKHINLLEHGRLHGVHVASSHNSYALGALMAIGSCASYAMWLIIQAKMNVRYPCLYSGIALMSMMGAIQSIVFALCVEKDRSQWKLGWNIRLLTVAYSGIVVSGLMVAIISWCVKMRGPLFASVFSPLMLVVVAIAGSVLLNEQLYVGSVMGSVLIIAGLYAVLWGKGKEMKTANQLVPTSSPEPEAEVLEINVLSSSIEKITPDDHQHLKNNHSNIASQRESGKHDSNIL